MGEAPDIRTLLGPLGVWASFDSLPLDALFAFGAYAEELGYGTLWVNESVGREPFAVLGALARATSRLTLGVGIASIHARDAVAAHAGARTLAELSGGRFVMGLGVSHRSSVELRGHDYGSPRAALTAYLDAYDAAPWRGPEVADPPVVLAALGPRMLALAASRAAGAFPFLVPASYVEGARRTLDAAARAAGRPDRPALVVAQLAILGGGPHVLEAARGSVARYLAQPSYRDNLLRAGFAAHDIESVADGLVDALVATGDAAALRDRIGWLHAAGADHVALVPLSVTGQPADRATALACAPR